MVKAELILSRSSYQAGTPIVGSVRITNPGNTATKNNAKSQQYPIRNDIVSARLYLAGRAHIGGNARTGKGSRWRSLQEITQLKKIYGNEHACLSLAKIEEESKWSNEWRSDIPNEDGIDNDMSTSSSKTKFNRDISPPKVAHIEQAERLEVETYLHPSNKTNANDGNDYSQLPTPHENNTVCFWMTNILELVDTPERPKICNTSSAAASSMSNEEENSRPGRGKFHGDMNPYRPLQLPDLNVVKDVCKKEIDNREEYKQEDKDKPSAWEQIVASENQSNDISANDDNLSEATPLEHTQLAFSFRTNLPSNVPPTISAECVKYFYSAVLVVTTSDGELIVAQCPYTVLSTSNSYHHTSSQSQSNKTSLTRVYVGDLHAIAHSAGLPTYITSTEASDATPTQLTVNANPPSCDIVSRRTAEKRTSTHRIVDGNGSFCGLMTLVGIGGPLIPGTRLGIRVRFPIDENDECCNGTDNIIPCHRVCCALVGEEYAIFEGSDQSTGTDNQPNNKGVKKQVKTRSYVFDSKYELVESGYTEAISMGLLLPLDCPVTVKTDLVEVSISLKIEFTTSDIGTEKKFSTIRLDLPCTVVHIDSDEGLAVEEDGGIHTSSIRTMQQFWNDNNNNEDVVFDDTDIQGDLKVLSLRMVKQII